MEKIEQSSASAWLKLAELGNMSKKQRGISRIIPTTARYAGHMSVNRDRWIHLGDI